MTKKLLLLATCALTIACERKPTQAELDAVQQPPATPSPGAWMWDKERKNPLDEPPRSAGTRGH